MIILAIDPGNTQTALVRYDTESCSVLEKQISHNDEVLGWCMARNEEHLAIEMIACYGMAVGKTVFDTVYWIGRFCQAWGGDEGKSFTRIYRKDVKMHLCNSMRAKDGNIRQALIDRYDATGGGRTPEIGTKSKPGPLYGMAKDMWAALGVAVTYSEQHLTH